MTNKLPKFAIGAALCVAIYAGVSVSGGVRAAEVVRIPASALDVPPAKGKQVAVLAGGCFWGVEGVFENVRGVISVTSGYAGGRADDANYEAVSRERTAHAEAVRIVYDPAQVSYATLLRIFFSVIHDPTQLNRQGPDTGPSYRSAIFPQSPDQDRVARAYIAQLSKAKAWSQPIVTRVETGVFYPAEAYHQDFMARNPKHGYIRMWDAPKLAAFKVTFPTLAR